MPYTPFQDGTQAFGISASPITVNAVTYIAEDINISHPTTVVEIKAPTGVPTGAVVIPEANTGTATLQLATGSTVVPSVTGTFTMFGATWILTEVGEVYTQGQYVKVNVSFRMKIN